MIPITKLQEYLCYTMRTEKFTPESNDSCMRLLKEIKGVEKELLTLRNFATRMRTAHGFQPNAVDACGIPAE